MTPKVLRHFRDKKLSVSRPRAYSESISRMPEFWEPHIGKAVICRQ